MLWLAPAEKSTATGTLEDRLWKAADQLRANSGLTSAQYSQPVLGLIYLDKPMRNHTLMQTIARANRVFPGKHSGLIVDYANVFASLEKALAIYAKGKGGATPVRDKQELLKELRKAVEVAEGACAVHGVYLLEIEALPAGSLDRLTRIANAVDRLISPDPVRKELLANARWANTLFQAVKPDPAVTEWAGRISRRAVQGIARAQSGAFRRGTPPRPRATDRGRVDGVRPLDPSRS